MRIDINNDWLWSPVFEEAMIKPEYDGTGKMETVRIPHTVKVTPLNYFDAHEYQMVSCYRKTIDVPAEWEDKKVFVTFDAVAHEAEVYVNGSFVVKHSCGYTAFGAEISSYLKYGEKNVIAVKCDSRESLNVPPFGFVIDYMTYGGIYREVRLDVKEKDHFKDVFVSAGADKKVTIKTDIEGEGELVCMITDISTSNVLFAEPCEKDAEITVPEAELWTLDDPKLYELTMTLRNGDKEDTFTTKFGFRDAVFKTDGFYLNGEKIKLRGLNRHQCWPYVGYAMPKSMQQMDADILKNKLGLNAVRTSHYPQSHHFIDRCDEIGLLVFTEIPGWQNIGDEAWKEQAVINTREMVSQYRNHPSIILWGVRINESVDCDELYTRTNKEAHDLDPTRQTSGVRYLKKSSLLEDVYAFNDFSHNGKTAGCEQKKNVTSDMNKPYFISEYNGHMFPTKAFDSELHRQEHALRHCNVLDSVMANEDILGSFGWCMFDYNTQKDFGSGDRICYHGVMDMFRNPKLAAAVYASQQDETPVLEVSFSMDTGEHPGGSRGAIYIFTNADSVHIYEGGGFIREYVPDHTRRGRYSHLAHPPILVDDLIGGRGGISNTYEFVAIKDGQEVKRVTRGPVESRLLYAEADRTHLTEGKSYDVAAVRIRLTDEHGNTLPFANDAVVLETEGPVEIIGPDIIALQGGMGGTYVRTTGEAGEGRLTVRMPEGLTKTICFEVQSGA